MPDERVAAARAHWAARFVANGTSYPDFEATLARALEAGAKAEQVHRVAGYPPVAFCSDPFGHGFCIVGLSKLDHAPG